ncbi:MAG TPA: hypothetical protein VGF84_22500 [Micromonosporaceae bacterium]|jgi:hypothetical protein
MSQRVPDDPTAPVPDLVASADALSTYGTYPWPTAYPEASPSPDAAPDPAASPGLVVPPYAAARSQSEVSPVPQPEPERPALRWLPRWVGSPAISRGARVLQILLVLAALKVGIDHTHRAAEATRSDLTSDTGCGGIVGDSVRLGVQVVNSSRQTVTLTGATVHGLPSDLVDPGPAAWVGCDPTEQPDVALPSLAPGAKQWVVISMTLTANCPGQASPTMTISYTDTSRARTSDFPLGSLSDALGPCPAGGP